MSQATAFETTSGYAPPTVTQFSVFVENKVGRLHDLLRAFDVPQVQICALSVHDATDHAVVRIVTNNAAQARLLLNRHELAYTETDVLVIELCPERGLARLCMYLLGAELNIRFAYPLMLGPNDGAAIAVAVDDNTLAGQILRRKDFRLFGEADLPKPG